MTDSPHPDNADTIGGRRLLALRRLREGASGDPRNRRTARVNMRRRWAKAWLNPDYIPTPGATAEIPAGLDVWLRTYIEHAEFLGSADMMDEKMSLVYAGMQAAVDDLLTDDCRLDDLLTSCLSTTDPLRMAALAPEYEEAENISVSVRNVSEWFDASLSTLDKMSDRLVGQHRKSNDREWDREGLAAELWHYLDFGLFFGAYLVIAFEDSKATFRAIGDDDPFPKEPDDAMEARCARVLGVRTRAARETVTQAEERAQLAAERRLAERAARAERRRQAEQTELATRSAGKWRARQSGSGRVTASREIQEHEAEQRRRAEAERAAEAERRAQDLALAWSLLGEASDGGERRAALSELRQAALGAGDYNVAGWAKAALKELRNVPAIAGRSAEDGHHD